MTGSTALRAVEDPPRTRETTAAWWLAFLAVIGAILSTGLTFAVWRGRGPSRLDQPITDWVVAHRDGVLDRLAPVVTLLGDTRTIIAITCVGAVVLLARRRFSEVALLIAGVLGASTIVVSLKLLLARPRPPAGTMLGPIEHAYSFPSGHTLMATTLAGLLALILTAGRSRRARAVAAALAATVAAVVGASRVYLGVHWATDVVGSWLMAGTWLLVLGVGMTAVVDRRRR